MDLEVFTTPGLGDSSYLVASAGEAALVDPQRDAWRFLSVAERRGWRVRYVLETHAHNDYVSGALEVRAATGAEILAPALGGYAFPHRPVEAGEAVEVGGLRLVARATPGHTFEHVAWDLHRLDGAGKRIPGLPDQAPEGIFSGGSLLIGSAGRTDLVGPEATEALTRAQFATIRAFAALPDDVDVYPTHGAGSFCVANVPGAGQVTSVGRERRTNAAMLAADEAAFFDEQLRVLGRFPAYYAHMGPINRAGPPVVGAPRPVAALPPAQVERLAMAGAVVVDTRDRAEFAAGHLPGSVNIELTEAFSTYVGWLLPFDAPVVLVLPEPASRAAEAAEEAVVQLLRIGYGRIVGRLAGGVDTWVASGRELRSYPTATMRELFETRVEAGRDVAILDVRQPVEWRDDGAIAGAERIFVADLPGAIDRLAGDREWWVVCTTGHRASMAASLLDAAGIPARLVGRGGVVGWAERFEAALGSAEAAEAAVPA